MDTFYKRFMFFSINECIDYTLSQLRQQMDYNTETLIFSLFPLMDFSCPFLFSSIKLSV